MPNRLYRNRGDGTFEDVTERAGVGILDGTASALFVDFLNRGKQDLLVVRSGGPLLFANMGNGRFEAKPDAFHFARPPQGTFTSAAVADYNRDGLLDIYFCDNDNNHDTSLSYDAIGNVTADATNQYLYDAEGRVCAVWKPIINSLTQYIYDAEGQRVAKGTITSWSCDTRTNGFVQTNSYLLGPSGEQVTELDGNDNWLHTNVYVAGQVIATYTNSAPPGQAPVALRHFHLADWLGTNRVQLTASGQVEEQCQNSPFGDAQTCSGSPVEATEQHFTGKERDAESGLDYFGARYYASNMGRWMSPDWASHPQAIPYASLGNPQSLNLYSYVNNNPLSQVDADGHFASPWHFLLTFVASIATGHDPIHAAIWGVKSAAVDFRKDSQSGNPADVHMHGMAVNGESSAQASAAIANTIAGEEASGDIGADQHTRGDRHALGHGPDNVWDPAPSGCGKFSGGLSFGDLLKHEFGDWLPSPGALWGALKDQMDGFRNTDPGTNSSPTPAPPGGGFNPGGMQCTGCTPPPRYFPAPIPPPMPDPSQFHRAAQ